MSKTALAFVAALGLSACGDTVFEQGVSGGLIGAGTAAVFDGDVGTGLAVGAVGGIVYCQALATCN